MTSVGSKTPVPHQFKMGEDYMFFWSKGSLKNSIIVGKPTSIDPYIIWFHFDKKPFLNGGHMSEAELIEKTDIIAVRDNEKGTIEVMGWEGKYQILNQHLFEKYVMRGMIELKN